MATAKSWMAIIQHLKAFVDGHYMFTANDAGVKPFTVGTLNVSDLDMDGRYPIFHVTPGQVRWSRADKMRYYSMEIFIGGLPLQYDNQWRDHVNDTVNDCLRIAEDLLATIVNGDAPFNRNILRLDGEATAEPFIDEKQNKLSGAMLNITLSLPFAFNACDVPGEFNLSSGATGSGTGGTVRYWSDVAVQDIDGVAVTNSPAASDQPLDTFILKAGEDIDISVSGKTITIATCKVSKLIEGDLSAYTSTAQTNMTGMSWSLLADQRYKLEAYVLWQSAVASTGIVIGATYPTMKDAVIFVEAMISNTDSASGQLQGLITSSGDTVNVAATPQANVTTVLRITGMLHVQDAGTLQLTYASEVNGNAITIQDNTYGELKRIKETA